ncbi:MAG: nickel pincer cofactor biosynthesis protein LarB [Lapillicoccus sp.]
MGDGPDLTGLDGIAELDLGRADRRGYAEAVYCEGKTPEQVRAIALALREALSNKATHDRAAGVLFTRCAPEHLAILAEVLPDAAIDETARLVAWPVSPPPPTGGDVLVLCAGTSDLPVAREALLTARHLGRSADLVVDVGVAGLHRVLSRLDRLRSVRVIVVVAGMDGALASVVAGLVSAPVVAVPTSVGYGAAFGGLAPLLSMLNACAPGVAVVNIDNGYGAGHLAAQIAAPHTD